MTAVNPSLQTSLGDGPALIAPGGSHFEACVDVLSRCDLVFDNPRLAVGWSVSERSCTKLQPAGCRVMLAGGEQRTEYVPSSTTGTGSFCQRTMVEELSEKVQVFKNCPAFSEMSEAAIKEIALVATSVAFKKGEFIFREGDPCSFFYVVKKGRVKSFKQSNSGRHFITNVSGVNDSIGAVVMFEGNLRFVSAKAMQDTTLLAVKRDDYASWVRRHPSVLLKMTVLHARVMNSAYERLMDMVGESASHRICNILYMLYSKFGGTLEFTCEEIADLSGTTTETAIRILAGLKASKILAPVRGKIHVLNQVELKKLSRGIEHVPGRI